MRTRVASNAGLEMKHRGRVLAHKRLWNKLVDNCLAPIHKKNFKDKSILFGAGEMAQGIIFRFPTLNASSSQLPVNPTTKYLSYLMPYSGLYGHLHPLALTHTWTQTHDNKIYK